MSRSEGGGHAPSSSLSTFSSFSPLESGGESVEVVLRRDADGGHDVPDVESPPATYATYTLLPLPLGRRN
jgi:hypothetical protein